MVFLNLAFGPFGLVIAWSIFIIYVRDGSRRQHSARSHHMFTGTSEEWRYKELSADMRRRTSFELRAIRQAGRVA